MPFDLIKKMLSEQGSVAMKRNQFTNFGGSHKLFLFALKF